MVSLEARPRSPRETDDVLEAAYPARFHDGAFI
jgi:hypothetical protein